MTRLFVDAVGHLGCVLIDRRLCPIVRWCVEAFAVGGIRFSVFRHT
jgi:hypothetical protein